MRIGHLEMCTLISLGRQAVERGEGREPPYGYDDERAAYWRMGCDWAADVQKAREAKLATWRGLK